MTIQSLTLEQLNLDKKISDQLGKNKFQLYDQFFHSINSSYRLNRFWRLFYFVGCCRNWKKSAELGVLGGYSIIAMAAATGTTTFGYDLFDDYQYNHSSKAESLNNIERFPDPIDIELTQKNLLNGDKNIWIPMDADLISIDLSNCGEIYRSILNHPDHFNHERVFILEGGSLERDAVEWMEKYGRCSIRDTIFHDDNLNNNDLHAAIIEDFPSVTIIGRELSFLTA